jgi:hypothetical protein
MSSIDQPVSISIKDTILASLLLLLLKAKFSLNFPFYVTSVSRRYTVGMPSERKAFYAKKELVFNHTKTGL